MVEEKLLTERHLKSLKYAVSVILSKEYRRYIKSIYLFGSCIRNNPTYSSDVDIFIFFKEDTTKDIIHNLKSNVHPIDYTLPEVDIHYSLDDDFSWSKQFNDNLKKEASCLWKVN